MYRPLTLGAARALQVPQLDEPPAWRPGLVLQDNVTVTADLVEILQAMIRRMNDASLGLPALQALHA